MMPSKAENVCCKASKFCVKMSDHCCVTDHEDYEKIISKVALNSNTPESWTVGPGGRDRTAINIRTNTPEPN